MDEAQIAEAIKRFDIDAKVTESVIELFDTMLDMEISRLEVNEEPASSAFNISSALCFAGYVIGGINIQVTSDFARTMAASMLGMDTDDIESDEEVNDVLLEVFNIVGGNLKSAFNDAELGCVISTPYITTGEDFRIETLHMQRYESLTYQTGDQTVLVQICLKAGEKEDMEQAKRLTPIDITRFSRMDIISSTGDSVIDLFDTMLEMELELADNSEKPNSEEDHLLGHVSFAGDVMGSVAIQVNDMFGRIIAAGMLDMNLEDAQDQDEIKDVIGEVTNIIAGNLKSAFCDSGLVCEISPPTITFGKNYSIEIPHMSKYERFVFRFGQFYIYIEVCVKINDSAPPEKQLEEAAAAIEEDKAQPSEDPTQAPSAANAAEVNPASGADQPTTNAPPPDTDDNSGAPPSSEPETSPPVERKGSAAANNTIDGSPDLPGGDQNLEVVMNIPLDIVVELGRTQIPIQEVLSLGPGSAIELNDVKNMPLNILANKKLIARGHVVVEDEKYGIRISEIVSSRKRLSNLG